MIFDKRLCWTVALWISVVTLTRAEPPTRQYAPDRQVDITHISIEVIPDFHQHTISGATSITFVPIARALTSLKLDAADLDIIRVQSDHRLEAWSVTNEDITLTFAPPIPAGQTASVQIWHEAEPQKGIYFRTPENGYPARDMHLFSQGEAHEAQHWYPNYDYPNERFTSEIICQVPGDMTVLSNGKKISETLNPETGLKAVHWRQEQPHVNYLIALVAGYLQGVTADYRGIPMGFYTPASQIDLARNSFKDTADMMAFFEEEIGIPYPWDAYNQVAVYDFVAGGMENTTLTVLTHSTLHPQELEPIHSSTMLVAHELAHQWFGDYLTCKDWAHIWLNEGFATYYENLYSRHQQGQDEFLYNMLQDARTLINRSGTQKAIFDRTYEDADNQFDTRAYQKGGWVLHMLRCQLGDDLFRRCIKTYVERHALQSVETADLRLIVEELSGRNFSAFFDQWVYSPGHPELDINYSWSQSDRLAKVTIQQTPARTDNKDFLWTLPATLRFRVDGETIDRDVVIDQAKQDFYVALPAEPNLVRFDPRFTLLADVRFNKPRAMLYEQLAQSEDVIGRLRAIKSLEDKKDQKTVEHLRKRLENDSFFGVRLACADALRNIHTDEAFAALSQSWNQPDLRVRQRVVAHIGNFYRPEARDQLLDIVRRETNPDVASVALDQLGRWFEPNTLTVLTEALNTDSFRQIRLNGALTGMRKLKDPALVPVLIKTIREKRDHLPNRVLAAALDTLAECSQDLDDKTEVRTLLTGTLNHPRQDIQQAAVRALGTLGDPLAIPIIDPMTSRSDRIASAARRALDKLRREKPNALPDEVVELRKTVEDLQEKNRDLENKLNDLEDRLDAMRQE